MVWMTSLIASRMARVLSYGLAQHAFLPADDDLRDPAQLPWSFETIGAMLLTGGVIEQAHHPKLEQPLVRVGVRMAAAIEQVFGKERLALDRAEGPLSFFEDFFFACEQLECPSEARFPPELRAKVGALAADWAKANGPAVRMLRLSGAPPDPDEVRAVLQPAFAGAKIWPDLTNELARAAVRQGLGERGPDRGGLHGRHELLVRQRAASVGQRGSARPGRSGRFEHLVQQIQTARSEATRG